MQIFQYSVLGAVLYLLAWVVPALTIKKIIPRIVTQVLVLILVAYFTPSPNDPEVAFFSGQYAFVGGVLLVGGFSLIQKLRGANA